MVPESKDPGGLAHSALPPCLIVVIVQLLLSQRKVCLVVTLRCCFAKLLLCENKLGTSIGLSHTLPVTSLLSTTNEALSISLSVAQSLTHV